MSFTIPGSPWHEADGLAHPGPVPEGNDQVSQVDRRGQLAVIPASTRVALHLRSSVSARSHSRRGGTSLTMPGPPWHEADGLC